MSSFAETAGKPIHCKAAIAYSPNEPLTTETIVVAPPKVPPPPLIIPLAPHRLTSYLYRFGSRNNQSDAAGW